MPDTNQPPLTGPSFELRIRRVLWILLGGMLVVAATGVFSAWALTGAGRDVDTVEHAADALAGVLEGMIDQETGVRGFILTEREPFLDTYGPGGATADSNRALLVELTDGIATLDLGGLDGAIAAWREIAEREIGLVRDGRRDEAVTIVESSVPKDRFDRIRSEVSIIGDQLRDLIDARNQRQADLERLLAVIGIAVAVVALVVITVTVRWLRRSVTDPLAALAGAVGDPDERSFSSLAGRAAGEVAALAHSADRLRRAKDLELSHAVVLAEQNERARIAADLHDGPVQTLFAVQLRLQGLRRGGHDDETSVVLDDTVDVLESTQADLRSLMFDLAPPGLGDRPIAEVLSTMVHAMVEEPTRVVVDAADDLMISPTSQVIACRVVVEAIRNVNRHAAAAHVVVGVVAGDEQVTIEITDDGRGFDVVGVAPGGHFGVGIMRSLVESLDGNFELRSVPGNGTTVRFTVPS